MFLKNDIDRYQSSSLISFDNNWYRSIAFSKDFPELADRHTRFVQKKTLESNLKIKNCFFPYSIVKCINAFGAPYTYKFMHTKHYTAC